MAPVTGLVVALALASCSDTAAPPAPTPTTSTSPSRASAGAAAAPSPAPVTGPLEKDWKSYGGTAYFGCPEKFSTGNSALDAIRPKIFDPKTGQYVAPAVPMVAAGETLTGAMCALTGTAGDMRVVYVVTTGKPAQGTEPAVARTTAYAYDFTSGQPLATKDLQPPSPELKLTQPGGWALSSTATGVAWCNAFTDGHAATSPPRTVVLSATDLSSMWDDPEPARVWQDVLAFHRNTDPAKTFGAELRRPGGEAIYQDNDIRTVDAELSDGPNKLVQITHWDSYSPPVLSTMFYDLNAKSVIKIGDTDRVSGGGLAATLSDGRLFVDGRGSDTSQFGFGVWNLQTQQWELLKTREDAKAIAKIAFFDDHLYITNTGGTFAVIALPATDPVAPNWSVRPFQRISDWTLVCRGETAPGSNGECKEIVMVQDQDGHYPGPWF
ncbi:hypothetical protein AWC20_25900 [Mycobacterium parmense]|nr:hypothetical protein AWC20_25900 [Mycobacterium parmense]